MRVTCVRAIPNLQRNQRSRRTFIAWIFHVQFMYGNTEYFEVFGILNNIRTEVCNRMIRRTIHILPATYHTTAAAAAVPVVMLQSATASACCCSTFAPDGDTRVLALCRGIF